MMIESSYEVQGSPPRVRGKERNESIFQHRRGITPARAGKSYRLTYNRACYRDHPRACGEKQKTGFLMRTFQGSPPRVRGKDCSYVHLTFPTGITPARAGKSR